VSINVNTVVTDLETGDKRLVLWISLPGEYGYWYNLSNRSRIPARFLTDDIVNGITNNKCEISVLTVPVYTEATLSEKERSIRDNRWNIIEPIVTNEPDVYEKRKRLRLLQNASYLQSL